MQWTTDGSGFVIVMHFRGAAYTTLTIQGRNLEELLRKLIEDEVDWIMEFDPRKWATHAEGGPVITGIDLSRVPPPEKMEDLLPGEKKPADTPDTPHNRH